MIINEHTAVVDTDFINHVCDTRIEEQELVRLLTIIFTELELEAVVHSLVYEKEMINQPPFAIRMFKEKIIQKAEFEDIFYNSEVKESYYHMIVPELYKSINGVALPLKKEEIKYKWIAQKNLGEIHAIAMCIVCNCGLFLSDDGGSKLLVDVVNNKYGSELRVYNRNELLDQHLKCGTTKISRKERKALAHV